MKVHSFFPSNCNTSVLSGILSKYHSKHTRMFWENYKYNICCVCPMPTNSDHNHDHKLLHAQFRQNELSLFSMCALQWVGVGTSHQCHEPGQGMRWKSWHGCWGHSGEEVVKRVDGECLQNQCCQCLTLQMFFPLCKLRQLLEVRVSNVKKSSFFWSRRSRRLNVWQGIETLETHMMS